MSAMRMLEARIACALIALAVTPAQRGSAQHPAVTTTTAGRERTPWVHESWTVQDGLPVNSVNWLLQDRVGYIWIATYDGLVRFDGVRFTVFNSASSEGLPSNRIIEAKEGRDGALWLRTEQGHLVRFRDGRFRHFASLRDPREASVSRFTEDTTGTVWVALPDGLWAIRDDSVRRVARDAISSASAVVARRDGTLWVASDVGIVRVTGGVANARVTRVPVDSALAPTLVTALYDDPAGTLWVTGPAGLWVGRDRLTRVSGGVSIRNPQAVLATPAAGAVWIADAGTLYRVDAAGTPPSARPVHALLTRAAWADTQAIWYAAGAELFRNTERTFTLPSHLPAQVAPEVITAILIDREGSVWLGTRAAGLHRLKPALFRTYGAPEGLASSAVYPTLVDRSGVVWAGTWGQGIGRIAPPNDTVTTFRPTVALNRFAYSFAEDRARTLWIATGEGLYACDVTRTRCAREGPEELRAAWVRTVYHDDDGRVWASTPNAVFRRDAAGWTKLDAAWGVPPDVRAFAQARDGSVWMGTNGGGLARLEGNHAMVLTTADGLPGDVIRAVYRDSAGYLWVGTEGRGLARLDPAAWSPAGGRSLTDRRIVRISSRDGLFDDAIHEILEDDFGRLWMSTNRGIFWVPRAELNAFASGAIPRVHSTGYTERDGMRNREANGGSQPAGAKGPDGRLWFPTLEGVVVVDPASVRGDTRVASVVVEQVVTRGASLRPVGDSVTLAPDQRDVQIEYTALTFLQPGNVRFRYRLEPYDPDWVDVGSRRSAFYTKLPPGRYTFRVAMSGAGGGWRGREAVVSLRVVPRLWETAAFRWTMLAALGTLLVATWRVRDARLRSRAALLERVVDERTAALRANEQELARQNAQLEAQAVQLRALDVAKTRFFANVSHELRTPLTLTIGPLEDLRAEVGANPRAARWIDLALRNSRRLLRLVNQILDVGKLEAGQMRLSPRPLDLVPFVRGIVSAFTPVAERKELRLTLDVADAVGVVMLDPDAFEKILTNLLSNAVKFTPEGGTVDLDLARDGDAVRLHVRDTGPGIPADQLVHVFERFYQVDESSSRMQPGTGIGLSLVKELVQLQAGTIEVRSGDAGTAFIVRLPAPAATNWQGSARSTPNGETAIGETAVDDGSPNDVPRDETGTIDIPTLLVVDDSADLRGYIRAHFESQFRVIEAGDGTEGIDLARRHLPDVIISDVMMPRTDGYTLVRSLRADRETDFIPVVLLTAQADDAQKIAGLERGADDYLTKPFEMRELGARVRNLSARHRRLRERVASASVVRTEELRPVADGLAPQDRAFVDKVRAAIQRRLDDPDFGVAELAREVAQDRSHLFRRVKQLLGQTPTEMIRRLRLEEAERLLMSEQGTVADVAYAVGFNSLSYFCECFRERYGATPAAYRDRATPAT